MMRYGYRFGMMPFAGLMWLICLIVIIAIAIAVYKITTTGRRGSNRTINSNAIEILKERYAKGEIDEEQYKKMRDTLEK